MFIFDLKTKEEIEEIFKRDITFQKKMYECFVLQEHVLQKYKWARLVDSKGLDKF